MKPSGVAGAPYTGRGYAGVVDSRFDFGWPRGQFRPQRTRRFQHIGNEVFGRFMRYGNSTPAIRPVLSVRTIAEHTLHLRRDALAVQRDGADSRVPLVSRCGDDGRGTLLGAPLAPCQLAIDVHGNGPRDVLLPSPVNKHAGKRGVGRQHGQRIQRKIEFGHGTAALSGEFRNDADLTRGRRFGLG